MTRYSGFAFILSLSFVFPLPVHGIETASTSPLEATSSAAVVTPVAQPSKPKTTVELSVRQKVADSRKEKIAEYAQKVAERLVLVAEKQEELIIKVESRIRKYEERKFDVSVQEERLIDAFAALEESKAGIAGIEDAAEEALATGSAEFALGKTLETVRAVQNLLEASHNKISDLIFSLQELADAKPVSSKTE